MKRTSKLLCLLLALAMVLTLAPVPARAEEVPGEAETDRIEVPVPEEETDDVIPETGITRAQIPFQVNPLYEGLYEPKPEDIPQIPESDEIVTHAESFQSVENAAKTMRNYMKNRTETYTVYVYSTNSDYNALFLELLELAVAHTGVGTEGDYLMWHLAGWGGEVSIAQSGEGYNYTYTYVTPYYTTAAQEQEMTTAVNNLINSLGVRNKSDYEKVCAVYDWICANVTYDYDNLEDTSYALKFSAYAALINKTAVCQGYALLFYRLMLELGVDTRFIGGDGGGPHAWNIVKLGDYYYTVDATWDAGYTDYDYFLKSTWTFYGHSRDPEFDYWEFHMDHPMAAEDYVHGGTATLDPYINMGYCGTEENNYSNAIWVMMRDGTLYIEGEGATLDYKQKELPYWYYWIDHIERAAIAEGITRLGNYSFYEAPALKALYLPQSLDQIGNYTFSKSGLETVEFSGGLDTLGESTFEGCTALKSAVIAGPLTTVGNNVFRDCTALENVTFADGPTVIGASMFNGCKALKSAVLPASLRTINANAFVDCKALAELVIPEGVEFLGNYAFNGCTALKSVTIPGTVTTIKQLVFGQCTGLESVTFNEGLTTIGHGMFIACTALTDIDFPDSLKEIQQAAFKDCTALADVDLPENLEILGESAFYGCSSLDEIHIPESVTEIGKSCFYYCEALKKANIPQGITVINNGIFGHCALEQLKLPEGITSIGESAFVFNAFTEVVIPEGVTIIDVGAFNNCSNLESVSLPSTLKTLYGFGGCSKLTDITLPQGLNEIGQFTFSNCDALESITIPASVRTIGNGCWNECDSLKTIHFLGSAPEIGYNAFTDVTATAYYPAGDSSWNESVMKDYYGTITWKVACPEHRYEAVVTAPTCQERGYTTYTCTVCGHSYSGNYTDPVDHVYEDDYCKWCGQGAQNIRWYSGTTSLNGTIDLNIYVILSKDLVEADDTFVRFTYSAGVVNVPMSKALHSPTDQYPNRYRFSCPIYAKQLTDNVTVQFMKGSQQIGKDLNYSVVQYCVNQIAKVTDPQEVALYKAMLNYGAAAQLLFDHNVENLANASLSEADKVLPDVDASAYKYAISGKEDGIRAKSATLMLEDVVKVRVYFTLTGDKTIDEFTFTIDGKEVAVQQNDKGYYVETDGIAAKDLEKMFSVQVGGITVKYGALSYVNSMVNGTKVLESNISKALYTYWQAAESYLG